ncbi:MAG: hypothetical protein QG591_1410 [Planctomycetota bacterium]|nr:hypothetical protein [Planctomycetota bacterium]
MCGASLQLPEVDGAADWSDDITVGNKDDETVVILRCRETEERKQVFGIKITQEVSGSGVAASMERYVAEC